MQTRKVQDISAISSDSFVLLRAEWTPATGMELIKGIGSTHVIVHSRDPHQAYFLYRREDALSALEERAAAASLAVALGLKTSPATPQVDRATPAGLTPRRCVVTEEGSVVGFIDASYRPRLTRSGRRGTVEGGRRDFSHARTNAGGASFSLAAEFPEEVVRGEVVSLLVHISSRPSASPNVPINLPAGSAVDIVVQARRGFALEERGEGRLIVSAERETLPLQFRLRGVTAGPALVRVLAFHRGQPLGALTLSPMITEKGVPESTAMMVRDQTLAPASIRLPDLSLLILEEEVNGSPALSMRLSASAASLGLNWKKYGPIFLRTQPLRYFQNFFRDIESLRWDTPAEARSAKQHLEAKGAHLFETLIPAELQEEIWRLRESINSVQVLSEEPWIPWELCKMTREVNGSVVEGRFFCEAFNITRWIPGVSRKERLSLNKVALIVPRDSDLPCAPQERDYMLSLAGPGRIVDEVPATSLDVRRTLASGAYDGLHFSGHGLLREPDPNRSAILLEEGGELTPEDLSGMARNLGQARPVVFLNACKVGRSAMSLTDVGGWARQFLRAGAGVFIGAYWSVYDQPAFDFAQAFYARLLRGAPVGQAAQKARLAVKRRSGDPTWLAYTVFADPLAVTEDIETEATSGEPPTRRRSQQRMRRHNGRCASGGLRPALASRPRGAFEI